MAVQIAEKLGFLFEPCRYKVAYGGRGGAKSRSFAMALLMKGRAKRMRFLCTREVQKSIKDSVHRLLADCIRKHPEFQEHYEVLETIIRGRNGTEFLFAGLSNQTADSIKSFEAIDICWVEEGQTITKKSWTILIPTIREDNSEIWVSFNPQLDTDETYKRFVVSPPPDAIVAKVDWRDNPWFNDVLEAERVHCKNTQPKEDYDNIWEGVCRSAVEGAIYAGELANVMSQGRLCNVPHDPNLLVHTVWDLGWNDSMAISLVQRIRSEIRVIKYIEDSHKTLDYYCAMLNQMPYNWGYDFLPHDGQHGDYKTGKSAEELLKKFRRKPKITINISVEDGIKEARRVFPQVYFDKTNAMQLVENLRRYRRHIPQSTGEPGSPVHDDASHGADNFRYLSLNADRLTNEMEQTKMPRIEKWAQTVSGMGYVFAFLITCAGYMGVM